MMRVVTSENVQCGLCRRPARSLESCLQREAGRSTEPAHLIWIFGASPSPRGCLERLLGRYSAPSVATDEHLTLHAPDKRPSDGPGRDPACCSGPDLNSRIAAFFSDVVGRGFVADATRFPAIARLAAAGRRPTRQWRFRLWRLAIFERAAREP